MSLRRRHRHVLEVVAVALSLVPLSSRLAGLTLPLWLMYGLGAIALTFGAFCADSTEPPPDRPGKPE